MEQVIIKCSHCGYEADAGLFEEAKRCPRGHDPRPPGCGKPLKEGEQVVMGQDEEYSSVAGSASPHEAVAGARATEAKAVEAQTGEGTPGGEKAPKK